MGAVWLGRDEVLGRAVAVKRVGTMLGASSPDLLRAEREARIAARVNHPHVVAVFDLVHDEDQKWLVMEYVEGTNLAEEIQARGRLTPDEAAPLLAQAAEALTAAHDAGIVHRDVKPSNILVTADGQVKLSDFGIARAEADASLTATGLVTGSPAYIAPEVASGRQATPASDVWSLGATAYHALAGAPPYDVGDNVLGALYRIVHEEPPRLQDGGWLAPLVAVSMTRDPARRWPMADVAAFLRSEGRQAGRPVGPVVAAHRPSAGSPPTSHEQSTQVLSTVAPAAPEPPPDQSGGPGRARRRPGWLPFLVGAAAVALVAMIGVLLLLQDDPPDPRGGGSPSASTTSPRATQPIRPTAAEMESFVEGYLETADADPPAGFALLTPSYQAASGGLSGYEGFWGGVTNVEIESIEASVDDLTVEYTYSYNLRGDGKQTDTVRMTLEQDDDGNFLVAGAETL